MVHTGYNPSLVALSVAIAVFASYTALDLGARMRSPTLGPRWAWIAGAAVSMGGGIWSMHFIGMLAFEMGMPAAYDLGLTLLSLLVAIGVTGAAFAWVSRHGATRKSLVVSGPLMGLGVAGMHYTGMAAMRMPGNLAYSLPIVTLSVAIAVTAATAALWLTFRRNTVSQKLAAACIMGLAVAGMHYTGMAAATFTVDPDGPHAIHAGAMATRQQGLALYVAGATFLILFIAMMASSFEQQRIHERLQASEAQFRAAVQAVRGFVWTNDANGMMSGEQIGWGELTGQSLAEYQGHGWVHAVHPEDRSASVQAWSGMVRDAKPFVHEHRVRTRDGTWRHFAVKAVPVHADGHRITGWVGVHTDVTEEHEARDHADMLLREVNHRVANSLALVAALAHMQATAVVDPSAKEALGEMQLRITAIAGIHRRLYTSQDIEAVELDTYLRGLVEELQASMRASGRDHSIRLETDRISLTTDKAVSLGVVVTELVTNAYKYAYPPDTLGEIRVRVAPTAEGFLTLTVEDDGIGWTGLGEPRGTGLGSRVIRAMATNLRSVLTYAPEGPGTRAILSFQT